MEGTAGKGTIKFMNRLSLVCTCVLRELRVLGWQSEAEGDNAEEQVEGLACC